MIYRYRVSSLPLRVTSVFRRPSKNRVSERDILVQVIESTSDFRPVESVVSVDAKVGSKALFKRVVSSLDVKLRRSARASDPTQLPQFRFALQDGAVLAPKTLVWALLYIYGSTLPALPRSWKPKEPICPPNTAQRTRGEPSEVPARLQLGYQDI